MDELIEREQVLQELIDLYEQNEGKHGVQNVPEYAQANNFALSRCSDGNKLNSTQE